MYNNYQLTYSQTFPYRHLHNTDISTCAYTVYHGKFSWFRKNKIHTISTSKIHSSCSHGDESKYRKKADAFKAKFTERFRILKETNPDILPVYSNPKQKPVQQQTEQPKDAAEFIC